MSAGALRTLLDIALAKAPVLSQVFVPPPLTETSVEALLKVISREIGDKSWRIADAGGLRVGYDPGRAGGVLGLPPQGRPPNVKVRSVLDRRAGAPGDRLPDVAGQGGLGALSGWVEQPQWQRRVDGNFVAFKTIDRIKFDTRYVYKTYLVSGATGQPPKSRKDRD